MTSPQNRSSGNNLTAIRLDRQNMLRGLVLILATIGLGSCATTLANCDAIPGFAAGEDERFQENRLYCAYSENSQPRLAEFLNAWSMGSTVIIPAELSELPEPVRHAYAIFEDFYQPKSLKQIGIPSWALVQQTGIPDWARVEFEHVRYLIAQSEIDVTVRETLPFFGDVLERWKIDDFRPSATSDTPLCHLDKRYAELLNRFLDAGELPVGDSVKSAKAKKAESRKRQVFLNQQLQISNDGEWRLSTDPKVSNVIFGEKLEQAIVQFSIVHRVWLALYQRNGDEWSRVQTKFLAVRD